MAQQPGLLDAVRGVGEEFATRRNALEAEQSSSATEAAELSRAVEQLDLRLARLSARQQVIGARLGSLDSEARRVLRESVWNTLIADRNALAAHTGRRRLSVAVLVSVTADANAAWRADVWVPVGPDPGPESASSAMWFAAAEACQDVAESLGGPDHRAVPREARGLCAIRVEAPKGVGRERLKNSLASAMDRARVQAVALHERLVEVSVVWLDMPAEDQSRTQTDVRP